MQAVAFAALAGVDWFIHRRLLDAISDIPPAEAEADRHATPEQPAAAA